jgi:feruloyl esterase
MTSMRNSFLFTLLTTAIALSGKASAADQRTAQLSSETCAGLQGFAIPVSAIGLLSAGATVQTAAMVLGSEKGNINGDFCKVIGVVKPNNPVSPNLEFEVNLPATWNRRVVQMGGGGYDGSLVTGLTVYSNQTPDTDTPVKRGYVTLGSDGGHKGSAGFDGKFGLDDEALLNFGKQSVKKTHDAAMAVIRKAYGQRPERFYFIGGSQGGHEALDAAARYPQDYDGVVAHYPAYNVTMLHLGSLNVGRALYAEGGAGWINPKKTKLIGDAVFAKCDALDGAKDGIISNVKACNAAFDIATLRCPDGADTGDTCLSDAQIRAVRMIDSPYKPGVTIAGMDTFPKWALLEGATFQGPSNFGQVRDC